MPNLPLLPPPSPRSLESHLATVELLGARVFAFHDTGELNTPWRWDITICKLATPRAFGYLAHGSGGTPHEAFLAAYCAAADRELLDAQSRERANRFNGAYLRTTKRPPPNKPVKAFSLSDF